MIETFRQTVTTHFNTKLSVDEITQKLADSFHSESEKFGGRFLSISEFTFFDRLNVIAWNMPSLKRKAAYLKGSISSSNTGSNLHVEISPNPILPWFAIVAFATSLSLFGLNLIGIGSFSFNLIVGSMLLSISLIYYPLSLFFRNRLKNRLFSVLES